MIGRNKIQERILKQEHAALAPDPFGISEVGCTILKVFDRELMESEGVPPELGTQILANPGWLFAVVRIETSGLTVALPFEDSEELIYSVFGNRVLLEGRRARILYRNQDIQNGSISFRRSTETKQVNLAKSSNTWNMAGVL